MFVNAAVLSTLVQSDSVSILMKLQKHRKFCQTLQIPAAGHACTKHECL